MVVAFIHGVGPNARRLAQARQGVVGRYVVFGILLGDRLDSRANHLGLIARRPYLAAPAVFRFPMTALIRRQVEVRSAHLASPIIGAGWRAVRIPVAISQ